MLSTTLFTNKFFFVGVMHFLEVFSVARRPWEVMMSSVVVRPWEVFIVKFAVFVPTKDKNI